MECREPPLWSHTDSGLYAGSSTCSLGIVGQILLCVWTLFYLPLEWCWWLLWSWWRWSEITDTVIFWYVVRNNIWSSSLFLVWAPKKPWTFLSGGSPRGVLCFVNELNCGTHPRVQAGFWWSPLYDQRVGTSSPTPWPPGRGEGLEIKLNHQ